MCLVLLCVVLVLVAMVPVQVSLLSRDAYAILYWLFLVVYLFAHFRILLYYCVVLKRLCCGCSLLLAGGVCGEGGVNVVYVLLEMMFQLLYSNQYRVWILHPHMHVEAWKNQYAVSTQYWILEA